MMENSQKLDPEKTLEENFTKNIQDALLIEFEDQEIEQMKELDTVESLIQFADYHIPPVAPGLYQLEAKQIVKIKDQVNEFTKITQKQFLIEGPRFGISEDSIKAVFPPKSSVGNYNSIFPHICFNRPSIPWELKMGKENDPWLALVLFHEDEIPKMNPVPLNELLKSLPNKKLNEIYKNQKESINLISVPEHLIPLTPQLQSHTRKSTESDGEEIETAFLFANRLPKKEAKNTVHLISLYDRFEGNKFISLYNWEFDYSAEKSDFSVLLAKASSLPYRLYAGEKDNDFYKEGYVGLPHFLRLGFQTMSLYQTPLLPYTLPDPLMGEAAFISSVPKPKYGYERVEWKTLENGSKMADVSFAAAFHLGQMLTLANKQVAQAIFGWKRHLYQKQKREFLERTTEKEPVEIFNESKAKDIPTMVTEWITELLNLGKIPFNYLVPYEQMLPTNSIRFFKLNKKWLKNCLDGMFTIGEEFFRFESEQVLYDGEYTGFILRSPIVGHYPDLKVNAFSIDGSDSELFFNRKLSQEVMIFCFKTEIGSAKLYLPTQAIHFALQEKGQAFFVNKRNENGEFIKEMDVSSSLASNGLVDLFKFKEILNYESSAHLAFQLVENSPKIQFSPPKQSHFY